MPPPKSPLDKPSSSHSRRPSSSRRSSSDKTSDKTPIHSSKDSKHGIKGGHASSGKAKDQMSDSPSGAKAPSKSNDGDSGKVKGRDVEVPDAPGMDTSGRPSEREGVDTAVGAAPVAEKRDPGFRLGQDASTTTEELERLRAAMDAQIQLNQSRERLARQLLDREGRDNPSVATVGGKARVSPIHEEDIGSPSLIAAFTSPSPTGLETASTESARTVRGGNTPAAVPMRTPSYPFPPMRTPGPLAFSGHRPFTALSPTVNPANYAGGLFDGGPVDSVMSGSVTPASTLYFQPHGAHPQDDPIFEAPNLYEMSLMLASEPGLDPWWTTVVQLMRDLYQADRATFNAAEEDELSLAYLPRGSSLLPSSGDTNETSNSDDGNGDENISTSMLDSVRPGLVSRHSFTSYEETKRDPVSFSESSRAAALRPTPMLRAKSYLSARHDLPPRTGTLQNAQLNLQSLKDHMDIEDAKTASWETNDASIRDDRGRIFPVLQALDYEADPLIDSTGVLRVLDRGKVIALTRTYPYLENPSTDEKSGGSARSTRSGKPKESPTDKSKRAKGPELGARISSFLGGSKGSRRSSRSARSQASEKGKSVSTVETALQIPRYEEYEQAPPSPWAQSPAPSPAVRAETAENPFFANTAIDEETFNPDIPQDYNKQPLEAIGVDRSWTVLHIPLFHPLLSRTVHSFRLDAAAMERKSAGRGRGNETSKKTNTGKTPTADQAKERQTPIAILSVLSPVIPYPSSLRHSLEHLSPHLATSFSLCRHYSNLENEIAGLSRKRPQTAGFGAVAPSGRPGGERMNFHNFTYSPVDESAPHQSIAGSMTSPSDYSGLSRSAAGSPAGTPGWDPGSVGLTLDKRSSGGSPSFNAGESYFASRAKPGLGRVDTGSAASITGVRPTSKDTSPAESRFQASRGVDEKLHDAQTSSTERQKDSPKTKPGEEESATPTPRQEPRSSRIEASDRRDPSPSRQSVDAVLSTRRQALRTASNASNQGQPRAEKVHTQLHSYGADLGATFPSLPATSASSVKAMASGLSHSRSGSMPVPTDMPPPSNHLKQLMLDTLPAHIFVALPQTGEMVWVNSRYLSYRGQTVPELYADPWDSLHPEDREGYLKAWGHAVRTGEQFSKQVRIRRFDGTYRWFYTRAVGSRDTRGVLVQWYGSHMDIHDQHIAELKAARQEEIEASEEKHRQLANLIPQIIFSATEEEGVNFCNEQWLSYTGQTFEDAMGLGFMDFIHPEDLAKCHIPTDRPPTPYKENLRKPYEPLRHPSQSSSGGNSSQKSTTVSEAPTETTLKGIHQTLSRHNSSSSGSLYEVSSADLSELAKQGIVKVSTDANGRLSYTTEVRLRNKDGDYRWHLVRCVEVDNISFGSGDGSWFGACTDINDHKLLEAKLKEAMESKGKFLSNMSHEIRTPLIGISGMVSFLQDTTLNDEQMDFTNTIQASASSLLNIINDILDLSKVDAGMMKLSYEWFHTRSLVEEVNEMVSTMAITKRLELNYIIDKDVPEMVKGDKFRIRQVLLNVVGNAIKFTTYGEVFSRCRVYTGNPDLAEDEIMLEYQVVDTGSGFTQEEADLIFKPFSQIDGSSTRQHGGSGLGLVISRQLVEIHGGKMEGSAVPGKGSTFVFTAKFGLPTPEDHPDPPSTPLLSKVSSHVSSVSSASNEATARAMKQAAGNPILANKLMQSPLVDSPRTSSSVESPALFSSSASGSEPSLRSTRSDTRSSTSSVAQSLAHFSAAARAGGSDLSQMKLELPDRTSPIPTAATTSSGFVSSMKTAASSFGSTPTPGVHSRQGSNSPSELKQFRPPMYSILLICPQTHSREATTQHIENTLPKDVPHQITPLSNVAEAQKMIGGEDSVIFTHIVLNLPSAEEIVILIGQIVNSRSLPHTSIVVLSDPVQRQEVIKMATAYDYEQLAKNNQLTFIYKPVKPSRFAVIFDPDKERDLSTDRNRSSAQQHVATQKQAYLDVGKRLGNKGLKVLLVEDNPVNQKVLLKYLGKVGMEVDLAKDGQDCTEMVFEKPHSFYSLILCDLHMPRKDGYQTCRDIRQWERTKNFPRMPIIALSANVMADVLDKCVQAGFNSYVTKPVDFKNLSEAMSNLLDPEGTQSGGGGGT
ncbi:Peroxide stress-activated histidine kinase mak1 [Hyphodiscus hymeniophilus]|uniref:histidine kinase n=1 Tax=Hyphodiscus hymeniophilus TaxID=353542 RepID=A0A9P6SMK6_9HELO|nr:Peroxide stress-activated histidine kinase mak1 [Hyphodiscus hymeniophilus]